MAVVLGREGIIELGPLMIAWRRWKIRAYWFHPKAHDGAAHRAWMDAKGYDE